MAQPRNKMILRLKEELDATLRVVASTREQLSKEGELLEKAGLVDDKFLRKLKELTASFNSLTESKIRLDKAERAMEEDLTPEEERQAVLSYLVSCGWNEFQAVVSEARGTYGEPA